METLHLLTAVHTDLTQHLGETAASVRTVRAALGSRGWQVRWHVAVDGANPAPIELPDADTLIRVGRQCGVSATRNLALAATDGTGWVFTLDGDDELDVPGWVDLVTDPSFGTTAWHATNRATRDGACTRHSFDQPRKWALREVEENWTNPMAFHPASIIARTDLVLAVGGWPALRVNEDMAWCFTLNELEAGLALPHVTLRYRKWAKQTTADPSYRQDKANTFTFITATVNARRHRTGLPPITHPVPGPASLYPTA